MLGSMLYRTRCNMCLSSIVMHADGRFPFWHAGKRASSPLAKQENTTHAVHNALSHRSNALPYFRFFIYLCYTHNAFAIPFITLYVCSIYEGVYPIQLYYYQLLKYFRNVAHTHPFVLSFCFLFELQLLYNRYACVYSFNSYLY